MGLLAQAIGQGAVALGIKALNPSVTAVVLCLEGVGAMAVGAWFYAEPRGMIDLVGVLAIVAGVALVQDRTNN